MLWDVHIAACWLVAFMLGKLNMYNFRKVVQDPNSGEFKHELFRKVSKLLLYSIGLFPLLVFRYRVLRTRS